MADVKRISGFRIQLLRDSKERAIKFAQMVNSFQPLLPLVELWKQEPFYLDDAMGQLSVPEIFGWGLNFGELFIILLDGKIIGTIKLLDIVPQRYATMHVWGNPSVRQDYKGHRVVYDVAKEIINYAFFDWGESGLGLMKLKAEICAANLPAIKAARALKFQRTGLSPLDSFYRGVVYDKVLLELPNQKYFSPVVEDLPHGRTEATNDTDLHTAPSVHESSDDIAASAVSGTGSDDTESDTGGSELDTGDIGGSSPELLGVGIHGEPFRPRKPTAI